MSKIKAIIAGGGTGGHIYPAIAIAHALLRHYDNAEILFVGALGRMEMEKVPEAGFKIIGLDIAGFDRSNLFKNLSLPFKLLKSRRQSKEILKSFMPDIVIGVGGYASFPILSKAQAMSIPTVIQEQNSYAGKSNKILARKANTICVANENMARFFPKEKIVLTGNPVRQLITNATFERNKAIEAFGLNPEMNTLLIVGGSLGALSVNKAIANGLQQLKDFQIIWQTGKPFYQEALELCKGNNHIKVLSFITNMDDAYAAADVIISRAGAMAISELCIVGKPVIFVPYPYAAEDHQTSNAMALTQKNATVLVANSDADNVLVKTVVDLMHDNQKRKVLGDNIKQFAITDADVRIINEIQKIINQK